MVPVRLTSPYQVDNDSYQKYVMIETLIAKMVNLDNTHFDLEEFYKTVLEGKTTWWEMILPSGEVSFGNAKTKMLGYPKEKFKNYTDFANIIHPKDHAKAMKAMMDLLQGKNEFYEVSYRIQAKDGNYISFYDCGQIIKREGDNITVAGFVLKVQDSEKALKQMERFKKIVLDGTPNMTELVSGIQK